MQFWNKVHNDKLEELNKHLEEQKISEEKKPESIASGSQSVEDNSLVVHKTKEKSEEA